MMLQVVFAVLIVAVVTPVSLANAIEPPLDRPKVIAAATEVIKQAHYTTLVTIAKDGHADARIVTPAPPDENLEIWISTLKTSRKLAQLKKDPRATLAYFDAVNMDYVTLIGKTTIVSDQAEMQKHWQAEWAPFYPQEIRTPNFIMVKFVPSSVEIVSRQHHLRKDPWGLAIVNLK